jgi:hypothetical protein
VLAIEKYISKQEIYMKIRSVLILGIVLLFGNAAFAQDSKIEITGDYSYIHTNPQNNNIIPTFSLNGGGSGAFISPSTSESKGNLKVKEVLRTVLSLRAARLPLLETSSPITLVRS